MDNIINIFCGPKHHGEHHRHVFVLGVIVGPAVPKQQIPIPMTIPLLNTQKVTVTLKPSTASGKPAKVDGAPTWTVVTGPTLLGVVVAPDGLSADLITVDDAVGDAQVRVDADADLGAGVVTISVVLDVTITSEQAASLGVEVGTPVDK